MGAWLRRLWSDEEAFRTMFAAGGRFAIAFLGYLMESGVVPTGVEGGGDKYGRLLMVLAFLVPAARRAAGTAGLEGQGRRP